MTLPSATGSAEAFETHVVPELDVLYRVARSITRNPTDAEDLVQETLLRAYRAIDRFDGRHPRAWLMTIMRNAQINRVRRRRPELLHNPDATFDRLADTDADSLDVEDLVLEATFDATVAAALADLPEKFRRVVELVDIEGLSYQQAADRLDVPIGTVMSRLHRARTRMRNELDEADVTRSTGDDDAELTMRLRRRWWRPSDAPLSCREVGQVLQAYLDGELESHADLVAAHLEDCRRCGLEEAVYTDLKASLARRATEVDADAIARLRRFGSDLAAGGDPGPDDPTAAD